MKIHPVRSFPVIFVVATQLAGCWATLPPLPGPEVSGGACLTDERSVTRLRVLVGLDAQHITDPTVCRRAAAAAYPDSESSSRLYDVAVGRLPSGSYFVYAPEARKMAGEFRCFGAHLDRDFRLTLYSCG